MSEQSIDTALARDGRRRKSDERAVEECGDSRMMRLGRLESPQSRVCGSTDLL